MTAKRAHHEKASVSSVPNACYNRWKSSSTTSRTQEMCNAFDPFLTRYLSRQHIAPSLHAAIVQALEPVYGKPLTVSHLKSFGKEPLAALAKSVQESLPQMDENSKSLFLSIKIPHHETEYNNLQWNEGVSLLQLCKSHPDLLGEYMEATCGGTMSCCTCHLYLSEKMYESLPEPSEAELDMLDLAFQVKETSRLACQVYITDPMLQLPEEDLVVTIPAEVVDLWA